MAIRIDKKVPLKDRSRSTPYRGQYPFNKLKVGDSFFIEEATKRYSIYTALNHYNSRIDTIEKIQITTRAEDKGIRVWRTA